MLLLFVSGASAKKYHVKQLQSAKELIHKGEIESALTPLKKALKKNWNSPEGEEAAVLLAESYLRIDSIAFATKVIDAVETYYINSMYENRIGLLSAKIAIQEGTFYRGAERAMKILFLEKNSYLYNETRDLLLKVLKAQVLHEEELLRLVNTNPVDNEVVGTMVFQLAQIYEGQGKFTLARNYIDKIIQQFPNHPLTGKAKTKKAVLANKGAGVPSILIVTPLSGDYSGLGQFVVQGAILAIEQHNEKAGKDKLSYRVIDTKAHPAETVDKVAYAMLEDNIIGIIGPVMSPTASTLAAWLSQKYPQVPMVSPTATDAGIAGLGTNIFQINTSPSYLAQSIARYSINCQKHKEYAVMTPDTDYGRIMAENFKLMVEKYGGTVLFEEFYEEGNPDYRANYDVLRLKKYNLDMERSYIAGEKDSADYEEGDHQQFLQDSTINFDALFIAASDPEDAALLASQVRFNKIKADLLGSSGWYSKKTIRKGNKYVEGAHFSTPLIDHNKNKHWTGFKNAYMARWGAYPDRDRVSGLTYNSTRFMLWGIKNGPGNVVNTMRSAKTVNGVYGKMKFNSEKGYNDSRMILKIKGAKFVTAKNCKEF